MGLLLETIYILLEIILGLALGLVLETAYHELYVSELSGVAARTWNNLTGQDAAKYRAPFNTAGTAY